MTTMARLVHRLVHIIVTSTIALVFATASASAQSPEPSPSGPDVFANMPGIVWLLIPLAIAGAVYLSRELGRTPGEEEERDRRQGAVSRALERQEAER